MQFDRNGSLKNDTGMNFKTRELSDRKQKNIYIYFKNYQFSLVNTKKFKSRGNYSTERRKIVSNRTLVLIKVI